MNQLQRDLMRQIPFKDGPERMEAYQKLNLIYLDKILVYLRLLFWVPIALGVAWGFLTCVVTPRG